MKFLLIAIGLSSPSQPQQAYAFPYLAFNTLEECEAAKPDFKNALGTPPTDTGVIYGMACVEVLGRDEDE